MPRQLLLDGDDVGALMLRVRTELGPDAVVVKAERVRTGGVAGFFAKERFELTVEVPDPTPSRDGAVGAASAPQGLAALLAAADTGDLAGSGLPGDDAAVPRIAPSGQGSGAADDAGARFSALLASLVGEGPDAGTDTAAHDAAPGVPGAGVPLAGVPLTGVPGAGAPLAGVPRPHPDARPAAPGPRVTAATFAPLGPVGDDVVVLRSPQRRDAPAAADTAPPAPRAGPADDAHPAAPEPAAVIPGPAAPATPEPAAAMPGPAAPVASDPTAPAPAPVTSAPAAPRTRPGADRSGLLAVGLPPALLGPGPADEPMALSDVVARIPRAPAPLRTAGAVVAVVGLGEDALVVAGQLARRLRVDPADVARAGVLPPAPTTDRAATGAATAAGPARVTVVALGVGPDEEDWDDAAAVLAKLAPDQTWAVADARLKTSDVRAWMTAVSPGRPFDAVAATRVQDTREPGTLLGLDAPVGWVDGLPASRVVWAAVLSERLDPGARWD